MRRSRRVRLALSFLLAVHLPALAADWLAPYDPTAQHRDRAFSPPTEVHWFDDQGRFHPRPFVYRSREDPERLGQYLPDRSREFPILFFGRAEPEPGRTESDWRFVRVEPPAGLHLLGTDRYGRDVLSRLLYGARASLLTGLLAALLAVAVGLGLGLLAGFYGGAIDRAIQAALELCVSIPWLYMLVAVRAWLPLDAGPVEMALSMVLIVGGLAWAPTARMVRGEARATREAESVMAARGFGASDGYLLRHHVAPASFATALTQLTLLVPACILAEVTLSFLGLGVLEPTASLGTLLTPLREVSTLLSRHWLFSPAVALGLVVVSYHVLANTLRDDSETSNFASIRR